jgi:hypothetical protein
MTLVLLSLFAASLTETQRLSIPHDFGMKPWPKWQAGVLLTRDSHQGPTVELSVFNQSGARLQQHYFSLPQPRSFTVRDAARTPYGTFAVCGSFVNQSGPGTYLALVQPTTQATTFIPLSPFQPSHLVASSQGTFWLVGFANKAAHFRHYDASGKLLSSAMRQVTLATRDTFLSSDLVVAPYGPGVLWYYPAANELLQLSPDGSPSGLPNLPFPAGHHVTGHAVTAKGELFISTHTPSTWSVFRLLPATREWQVLATGARADHLTNYPIYLIGAEGNTLIAHERANTLRFFTLD